MKSIPFFKVSIIFFITLFCFNYSFADKPEANPFLPNIPRQWTKITPGPTHFMGRDLAPTCSGYPGTDSTYSFFVKGGSINNLIVFFQGGGACWDSMSCLVYNTYSPDVTDEDNPFFSPFGLFDFNNPENPFKDWNFVFIPYCTGDIHVGSNDYQYINPYTNQPWTISHRGHDNFLVVLKWITKHFVKPHEILVTGSSAGSYGAAHGFPWISEAYPLSKTSLLGDAGMGVSPEGISMIQAPGWNAQYPEWIFDGTPPTTTPELWNGIAAYYPHRKIAEFTNAWDMTQIFFFDMVLQALGLPHPNSCSIWNALMLTGVAEKQSAPNYRSYVAAGTNHTLLGLSEFYTENSAGVTFLDWLKAMMNNRGGTKGHGAVPWENVMCFDCGAPAYCPY